MKYESLVRSKTKKMDMKYSIYEEFRVGNELFKYIKERSLYDLNKRKGN